MAKAFGFDRSIPILRTNSEFADPKFRNLDGIKRRMVCTNCNNGWMNRLEHGMESVAEWLYGDPKQPLGAERQLSLRMWALKTHILLCYIDGNADRFGDDDWEGPYVVPPVSLAREMHQGDLDAIGLTTVGVSRCSDRSFFAWSFDFPTVVNFGPHTGLPRFSPATVITFGGLQLWIAAPYIYSAVVHLPRRVATCTPELRPADLAKLKHPLSLEAIVVDFGL